MKTLVLLCTLTIIIILSGCVEPGYEYSDDALKLEFEIDERAVPNQVIELVAYLTNQVEDEVKNVFFRVSDPYGLSIVDIDCGNGEERGSGCYFSSIPSMDEKEVTISLRVPSEEEIAGIEQELRPELTLEYDYHGQSVLLVPIVKKGIKPPASTKLSKSQGPIKVDISKGIGVGSEESGGAWEREGSVFSIAVDVEDVLNPDSNTVIKKKDFKIVLSNFNVYEYVTKPRPGVSTTIPGVTTTIPPTENLLDNPGFEEGWTDVGPEQQQPNGWTLSWVRPGDRLWDSPEVAHATPECVHKLSNQLPENERRGGPNALILDGSTTYKIFSGAWSFGAELKQTVTGLSSGSTVRLEVPIQVHTHGDSDSHAAQAGVFINGKGSWHDLVDHQWVTITESVTVPKSGTVEVVIRVKSKWDKPKDFFIDALRLVPEVTTTTMPETEVDLERLYNAICEIESGCDPYKENPYTHTYGELQFMPSTWSYWAKRYGEAIGRQDIWNENTPMTPENQRELGYYYLSVLWEKCRNVRGVAVEHYGGECSTDPNYLYSTEKECIYTCPSSEGWWKNEDECRDVCRDECTERCYSSLNEYADMVYRKYQELGSSMAITSKVGSASSVFGRCDFDVKGNVLMPMEDIVVSDVKPMVCVLRAGSTHDEPWIMGKITAEFYYKYKVVKTCSVQVVTRID